MKILFLIQSLKGTIEATELCGIIRKVFDSDNADIFPVTDGGDGFLNTVHFYNGHLSKVSVSTIDASGRPVEIQVLQDNSSVFIESADIIGLKQLHGDSDPLMRSTEGLGSVVKKFYDSRKTVYIGLGGSATVDIGFGMLTSMGFKTEHYPGTSVLRNIMNGGRYPLLRAVCDVKNTLEGERGAIIYARQKGVKAEAIDRLSAMFEETSFNLGVEGMEYCGSAGGLGAATAYAGGRLIDNFSFMNSIKDIESAVSNADIVVVTEGQIDCQSFYGKITGRIIDLALECGKRVIALTGENHTRRNDFEVIEMGQEGIEMPVRTMEKTLKQMRKMI